MLPPKCSASAAASGGVASAGTSLACAATTVTPGSDANQPSGNVADAGSLKGRGLRPGANRV